ncbi:MAG TPA: response regulator [Xanthobacteraceae bacterium]
MRTSSANQVEAITGSIRVLIVEDNQYLRKLVRNLLVNIGVKKIDEVDDALAGFEVIKAVDPDIVMLEWELPMLNGAELTRIIRAPGMLTRPSVPIIMFSRSAPRGRVAEAKRLGVDAYLTMPMSAKALADRIITALANQRPPAQPEGEKPSDNLFMV